MADEDGYIGCVSMTNNGQARLPAGQARIQPVEITEEMQRSYLDYAMSVIVARALPDVRDGLKPVQRRIIYGMLRIGLTHTAHFSKAAKVVGEILGKYHPHGDQPVYEALVRMAQNFSMRIPLITGQGNFGSIDGDPPAAMRYTECKLASIAEELLRDIDKATVDWIPNFDGTLSEPTVLPSVLPALLLNGASGIAVGMATNIPPHNLAEVCTAISALIDNPEATVEDLMEHVKGPDFPTGGAVYDITELTSAYSTGRGKVMLRGKAEIEEKDGGRAQIVISEIPYQVNKASLVTKIADLAKEKRLEGIADLRDESDRRGLRVVVELKKDARSGAVLNNLYKFTQLQVSFPANFVALVDGAPQTLTLKVILAEFIKHRQEVVRRRSQFELEEAKKRAHILEGLKIAVDNIDAVIELIKKARDVDEARTKLIARFKLTEVQAQAILDLQLKRLAALERQKIEDELEMTKEEISYLEDLLAHPEKILKVIKDELAKLSEKYGDDRRTKVYKQKLGEFSEEELIPNVSTIITLTASGYIKRQMPGAFRTQARGGKGVTGITTKEEDVVSQLVTCQTHDQLLFFTNLGKAYSLRAFDIDESLRTAKGTAIVNLIDIAQDEQVLTILPVLKSNNRVKYILMVTEGGTVKKTKVSAFENIRRSGIIAIKLDGDTLKWAKTSTGDDDVFLVSEKGKSIRFKESDVRKTGRATMGVRGIRLAKGDKVIGAAVLDIELQKADLLTVAENGLGKRTPVVLWHNQKRGGSGVKAASLTKRTGNLVCADIVTREHKALVLTSKSGQVIRLPINGIPRLSRATQGVTLMRFSDSADHIAAAALISKEREEEVDKKDTKD